MKLRVPGSCRGAGVGALMVTPSAFTADEPLGQVLALPELTG